MIDKVLEQKRGFLLFKEGEFLHVTSSKDKGKNRETWARFYSYIEEKIGSAAAQVACNQIKVKKRAKSLPKIIQEDVFLTHYAMGWPLSVSVAKEVLRLSAMNRPTGMGKSQIMVGYNKEGFDFFDVNATPPGLLAKFFRTFRLKADEEMLDKVRYDLQLVAKIEDHQKRLSLTYALLSFSAAYRELNHRVLEIPHPTQPGQLVSYQCKHHLIAEGVKTISLFGGKGMPSIYLCQGTEIWPSQPLMLGSILANFAEHGSASQAYAHSWRRIHKQLRDLQEQSGTLPIVMGHSMGGALAMQIALYSHDLIDSAHAYNPPVAGERDALFYKTLPQSITNKMHVYVNLDDPAFWRIGAKVIGNVTLFMGRERFRYYPVTLCDTLLFFPAIIKFILNIIHAFPAHQRIIPFCHSYLEIKLSPAQIALENSERVQRFDYLRFFPKLYDPLKAFISLLRKCFKWQLEEEFLRNEIEILALHERDLIDTQTEQNRDEVNKKLESLAYQKSLLREQLFSLGRK